MANNLTTHNRIEQLAFALRAPERIAAPRRRACVMARNYKSQKPPVDYLLHVPDAYLRKMHGRGGTREYWLFPAGGQVSEKDALAIIARPDIVVRDRGLLDGCPQSWGVLRHSADETAGASA
jgi:hypothetical protein